MINVFVQYNGGFLPYILLLTQAPVFVWFDGPINYALRCLLICHASWLCMVINISVQCNIGLLPDIILLTQGYYHRGTRLNTM